MNLYLRMLLQKIRSDRRPRMSVWDVGHTTLRVLPNDLDIYMHMNNGRYLTVMDIGRMDLMVRSGFWKVLNSKGWYPVVAGLTISYRKSLLLGQKYDLYTELIGFDDRWGYIEQTVAVNKVIYAQAIIRTRFLKRSGGSVNHDEIESLLGPQMYARPVAEWITEWTEKSKVNKTYEPRPHGVRPPAEPAGA